MKPSGIGGPVVYVDNEKLQPGDVILSRGNGLKSDLIAVATKGKYSHACLVLDNHSVFEADGNGVGFTSVPTIVVKAGSERKTLWMFSDTRKALVLRHPTLAKQYPDQIGPAGLRLYDAVHTAVAPYLGQPYSHLQRLPKISDLAKTLHPIFGKVLGWCGPRNLQSCVPGLFCSEVIAKVYADMKADLFTCQLDSDVIAPNDYSRKPCTLTQMDFVVPEDQVTDFHILAEQKVVLERKQYLPGLVSIVEGAANIEGMLERLKGQAALLSSEYSDSLPPFEAGLRDLLEDALARLPEQVICELEELLGDIQRDLPLAHMWLSNSDKCGPNELLAFTHVLVKHAGFLSTYGSAMADRLTPGQAPDVDALLDKLQGNVNEQLSSVQSLLNLAEEWRVGIEQSNLSNTIVFNDVELPLARFTALDRFVRFRTVEMLAVTSDEVLNVVMASDAAAQALKGVSDPLLWLRENIDVTFPEPQIMRIAIRGLPQPLLRPLVDTLTYICEQGLSLRTPSND